MSTLCTRSQVKTRLGITSTADDVLIDGLLADATSRIQNHYKREFTPQVSATARDFKVVPSGARSPLSRYPRRLVDESNEAVDLVPYDLRSATTVVLHPGTDDAKTLTAGQDYTLLPVGGDPKTGTYTHILISDLVSTSDSEYFNNFGFAQLRITGNWGAWATAADVAADVQRAAINLVASWHKRSVQQVTGYALGDVPGNIATPGGGWDIPFAVHRILREYFRTPEVF